MNVYVFGNRDVPGDEVAFRVAKNINGKIDGIDFVNVSPNEDLPFNKEKGLVLLDVIEGIKSVTVLNEKNLDKLVLSKSVTAHDYDLGFQLKYLKKLGKISKLTIIGLPQKGKIDYFLIQSILRKLVAQEMQGS